MRVPSVWLRTDRRTSCRALGTYGPIRTAFAGEQTPERDGAILRETHAAPGRASPIPGRVSKGHDMKRILFSLIATLAAIPSIADKAPVTICNVTTRGTQCRTVIVTPPLATIAPMPVTPAPQLAQPVFCDVHVVYEDSRPDVTAVAAPVSPLCSEDHARAALSSKLNDLLLGERLPR